MNCRPLVFDVIARQYNEKWRFPDYDRAVKKLQCYYTRSFLPYSPRSEEGVTFETDVPVYVCKFSPSKRDSNILAVANENGTVCLEDASKDKQGNYIQTHNNTVFDLAWVPGERQFVTVSGDHSAKLWDCGEGEIKIVSEFLGHSKSIKCVYFKPENTSVFATGSRDGSLILWDVRCSRKCSKLPISHLPDQVIPFAAGVSQPVFKRRLNSAEAMTHSYSVTALVFQNDNTLISCGSAEQFIRVWDMRKTYSRSQSLPLPKYQLCAPSAGFSHMCIDPAGTKIYANCMDSYIYCFDVNTYQSEPISAFCGHQNSSFYVKSSMSHDGLYLLSGSSDKLAYIWNTKNAELSERAVKPVVTLPGHVAEVACSVMSLFGDITVATCSDDSTYRLWYNCIKSMRNENEVIESAESVESDHTISVRTEWFNKRKRTIPCEDIYLPVKKKVPCSLHFKKCSYYANNLSVVSCNCQCMSNSSGLKRPFVSDSCDEMSASKRRLQLELQETTPPKTGDIKGLKRAVARDLSLPMKSNSNVKFTLKRKLSDLPGFIEDSECKRKANERVLVPVNDVKTTFELDGVCVNNDMPNSRFENLMNSPEFSSNKSDDDTDAEKEGCEFSSPTTNLPNYIEDGTSPYIHRCIRVQKENVDWLTKLRKNSVKKLDIEKCEDKDSSPKNCAKNEAKTLMLVAKRKAVRSGSVDGKNQTLLKYFKISSKSTDINFVSQEVQKKTF